MWKEESGNEALAKHCIKSAKYFFELAMDFSIALSYVSIIIVKFEPIACIIGEIWLLLLIAYWKHESKNRNFYKRIGIKWRLRCRFEVSLQLERNFFFRY